MGFFNKRYHPPGTPPGTLTEALSSSANQLTIQLLDYTPEHLTRQNNLSVDECRPFLNSESMTWIHVEGQPTEAALIELGDAFQLHSLALEDVLNTGQRPKVETYDDQLFIVMSLPVMNEDIVEVDQISFFLGNNYLISFCQRNFSVLEPIVKRLQEKGGRLRTQGGDYLLYCVLDMVIDQGFPVLENFGLQLEELEEEILVVTGNQTREKIHILKRELILLRRMLWPQREVISELLRYDHLLILEETKLYLRDCYDHTIQVMDLLETYRDMTSSMLDIYLSSVSNHMNEIMRVLTIIATIFIPLTFIVGVYGMNFDRNASSWNMPELSWPYGYLLIWFFMVTLTVAMLIIFRRRGWF